MKIARPDLAAYALAGLGLLCITLLLAMGRALPDYLPLIVMTLVGTGGGLSLNTSNGSETVTSGVRTPSPAPAGRPAQAPSQVPGPRSAAGPLPAGAVQ